MRKLALVFTLFTALFIATSAFGQGVTGSAMRGVVGTLRITPGNYGLTDPNADRILFWDDSANAFQWLTAGSGLTITGTTMTASGSSGANTALSNLASVAINTSLLPGTDDGAALGSTTKEFSDLFLATGGVINWNAGDCTLTHSSALVTLGGTCNLSLGSNKINKVTITAPASASTLTIADGKTLTASNTLTFTGTDLSSVAFGAGGTVLYNGGALGTPSSATLTNATGLPLSGLATQATNTVVGNATSGTASPTALAVGTCSTAGSALNWTTNTGFGCNTSITAAAAPISGLTGAGSGILTWLATPSSANLISAMTDETGSGALVFAASPTFTGTVNTAGIATTGTELITSSSATSFVVGPNGTSNPSFQIDASTASSANGLKLTTTAAGNGITLASMSSGSNDGLTVSAKGSGNLTLNAGSTGAVVLGLAGTTKGQFSASQFAMTPGATSTATTSHFSYTAPADTSLTAATNAVGVAFDLSSIKQHASNTTVVVQQDMKVLSGTHSFVTSGGNITAAASFAVDGGPSGGTNATINTSTAIWVPTKTLANTTNGYAAYLTAPSGATNNYALYVQGTVVNAGTAPSIAAGAGAGTSPTIAIAGTNNGGEVTLTTGSAPTLSATAATITYTNACPADSAVVLTAANSNAALLSGITMVYASGTTTAFTITSGTTALTGATQYIWDYQVTCW